MLMHATVEKMTAMRLTAMAEAFQRQLTSAQFADLSFEDRVGMLIDQEWTAREQRKLQRRLQVANLRHQASLVKNNLAEPAAALACQIVGLGGDSAILHWEGEPANAIDPDTVFAHSAGKEERAERRDAEEFLQDLLKGGEVLSNEVYRAAEANGISKRTLWRAKTQLGIKPRHEGQPGTKNQRWWWNLPRKATGPASKIATSERAATFGEDAERITESAPPCPKVATSADMATFERMSGSLLEPEGTSGDAQDAEVL
jgi:hypothetical protein